MRAFCAAIFDMNGTLFWDSEINYEAWDRCIRRWLGHEYPREEYALLNGRSTRETLDYLFKGNLDEKRLEEYEREEQASYAQVFELHRDTAGLAPGAEELLEALQKKGIRCGIVTSASPELMERYYRHFHLDRFFAPEYILTNDGSIPGKPNPDMYLAGLNSLEVEPSEAVVFEDSASGIRSAHTAGIERVYALASPGSDTETTSSMSETTALLRDFNHFLELWK